MMKLILAVLIVASSLLSGSVNSATPSNFELGTHYQVIRDQASKTTQLTEHFSLYCGHCFSSEALFKQLKSDLNGEASFNRSHVTFFPQQKPQWAKNMTFAFAAAKMLKVEDKIVDTIFDYHFNKKIMLGEIEDISDIFSISGISKQQFKQTITSPEVQEQVNAMVNAAKNDKVRFTPDLIVNNKYRVKLSSISEHQSPAEELTRLVKFLLTNP